jgi:hypothetical protein
MLNFGKTRLVALLAGLLGFGPAEAASIAGQVQAGGGAVKGAAVTLYAASNDAPARLTEATTDSDGHFALSGADAPAGAILYIVAKGGQAALDKSGGANPAISFLSVLGPQAPANVVINEFTTIASVWTGAQFLDGAALRGNALGLKIAAGNVPNFVDPATGGWGGAIQDPLNGAQTPTMANFATLADALSGCATRVTADACERLFTAATTPKGEALADTLTAAVAIARYPWYLPKRVFALVEQLYPVAPGKTMRAVPFMPYLNFAPSAWVLPLKFDGGGYRAGGKAMFDSEGNLWVGDNFTVGWQAKDSLWQGNATKFAPNGRPLSPITTGFAGGGMQGGTFGAAVDSHDNAWLTSYGGKSIAVFDKNGKPQTPPEGITFDGKLGLMQGVIVTPSGDVWAVGVEKDHLVFFPNGDWTKGRIVCEGASAEPCKSFKAPFHLAIDQKDRIWVTGAASDHVTRFSASDPTQVENFATGYSGSGMAIDSHGDAWVTNRLGNSLRGLAKLAEIGLVMKTGGDYDETLTYLMSRAPSCRSSTRSAFHRRTRATTASAISTPRFFSRPPIPAR